MTSRLALPLSSFVIWLVVLMIMLRTTRATSKNRDAPQPTSDSAEEIELLRYENAMLRAEQQRALSLGKVGERVREQIGTVLTWGTDDGDEAWGTLVDATVLRETLLSVCQDLQTAIRHVQLQLNSGVPMPELDRRRGDT